MKFTDKNGIVVDDSLTDEIISIYDPEDNLLITTGNSITVDSIRLQILEKDLKGYYAMNENGERYDIGKDTFFPLQGEQCKIVGEILRIQLSE